MKKKFENLSTRYGSVTMSIFETAWKDDQKTITVKVEDAPDTNAAVTDVTTEIGQIITGLKTIHNQENLRFLRNCNNSAKQAKGQYILFLNNDTQVQENWLAPLVELMEKDTTIGMTGSKLVYGKWRQGSKNQRCRRWRIHDDRL